MGKLEGTRRRKLIITISIIAVLLILAIIGTVMFLKDDGTSTAVEGDNTEQTDNQDDKTNLDQDNDNTNDKNTENTDSTDNKENTGNAQESNNQNSTNNDNNNTNNSSNENEDNKNTTSNKQNSNTTQETEFYVYKDKLVAEDFLVGWTPVAIKAISENISLYKPQLEAIKKSYTEADITFTDDGEIIFPEEVKYNYTRPGERIFYEIQVTNTGKMDLKNVKVYDSAPEKTTLVEALDEGMIEDDKDITWEIDIPKGETVSIRFVVIVNEEESGTVRNTAIVNGDETNETENPIIAYNKSVKQTEPLREGDIIDYTITVKNTGEVDTIIKQVSDNIPEGTTYVDNSASHNAKFENEELIWKDLELEIGETINLTFQVKINELEEGIYEKTIPNIALVDGDETNKVENEVIKPHIISEKSNSPTKETKLHEGDLITYTITVGNDGTDSKVVTIEDSAPEGTTLKEIITEGGEKVGTNGVKWVTTLEAGELNKEFKFSVTVNELPEGTYSLNIPNTALVDKTETNKVDNDVVKPHITSSKSNDPGKTKKLHEGDVITYTITVSNDGTDSKVVTIEDSAPEGTTLKEIITEGGVPVGTNGVKWVTTLEAGELNKEFKFSVTVNELPEGTYSLNIPNVALVDETETNKVENDVVKPHITSSKSNEPGKTTKLHEGDEIVYTIKVSNDGTDSKVVTIEDSAPEGTTLKEIITEGGEKVGTNGVKWTAEIKAGELNKEFKFSVTVNKLPEGTYSLNIPNVALVDEVETNKVENDVVKPHITQKKESTPTSGTKVKYEDIITYKIIVENDGSEAKEVTITDNIPEYTEFESVQNDGEQIKDSNGKTTSLKWVKNVPAKSGNTNGKVEVTFKVKVTGNATDTIVNVAMVDSETTNKTEHPVERTVSITSNNYTGKNYVIVLDLSSSMLQVKKKYTSRDDAIYKSDWDEAGSEDYVYSNKVTSDSNLFQKTKLYQAEQAIKDFAKEVLSDKDRGNTITLITFNYGSKTDATIGLAGCDLKYGTGYLTDYWKNHNTIKDYVGANTLLTKTTSYNTLETELNKIKLVQPYLLTDMLSALKKTNDVISNKKFTSDNKEIEVIFIGDGRTRYTGEAGTENVSSFTDEATTMTNIASESAKIKQKAGLYTVEYDVPKSEETGANLAFKAMTGESSNAEGAQYRYKATATNLLTKLKAIVSKIDAPITGAQNTDTSGKVTVNLPTNTNLVISDKKTVTLKVSGETDVTFTSLAQINSYFATNGRIKYDSTNYKFIIDCTKFPAGSTISLNYYYVKR